MQHQIVVLPLIVFGFVSYTLEDDIGHHGHDDYEYSPYHFDYKVHDDKEYLEFGQEEEDDGKGNVHGHYHVMLPDGRHQRVDYHVSGYSGFIADVKFDGEAQHPSHHGHHSSGYRLGKSLSFGEQPILEARSGVDDIVDSFPSESQFESFAREGKSLTFNSKASESDDLPTYSHSAGFGSQKNDFGKFGRQGKSLTFENKHEQSNGSPRESFRNQDSGSFKRQGKSLDLESEDTQSKKLSTHAGSSHVGSWQDDSGSHDSFGSFGRQGKSFDFESNHLSDKKHSKRKSSLISRRRIDSTEDLETSASEQVISVDPFEPVTFFDLIPRNVESPFSENIHDQLQSRNLKNNQQTKEEDHKISLKSKRQLQLDDNKKKDTMQDKISNDNHVENLQESKQREEQTKTQQGFPTIIRGKIIRSP